MIYEWVGTSHKSLRVFVDCDYAACSKNNTTSAFLMEKTFLSHNHSQGPDKGGRGGNAPGRHFWWKEGIANGLSRMKLRLDFGLSFRFWLRLDLPYVPVWPGLSRFKRLFRCPIPVSKMSQNFTSVKFSKLTPAWWCIVMK